MELKGNEGELTEEEQRNAIITTITLDVSNKHLREVPKSIKNFTNIEVCRVVSYRGPGVFNFAVNQM